MICSIDLPESGAFLERWLSGRKRLPAKKLYGQKLYRGFESLPLRIFRTKLNPAMLARQVPESR